MEKVDPQSGALDLGELPAASLEDKALGAGAAELAQAGPGAGSAPALTEEQKKLLEAKGLAAMIVELGASVAVRRWPLITFTSEEKLQTVELATPVLVKYDIGSAWLDKFKEEIALATFLAQLVMAKRAQVEAAKPQKPAAGANEGTPAPVQTTALEGAVADPLAAVRRP